jgi:hypothetical protein
LIRGAEKGEQLLISIQVSDGELREFQKGDILEVLDITPSRGHITFTESGAEVLFTNHP